MLVVSDIMRNCRGRIDTKYLGDFLLGKLQNKASQPDMLSQSAGLKIDFLWFQCIKLDRHKMQKSNATLSLWTPVGRERLVSLQRGIDEPISWPYIRAVIACRSTIR